MKREMLYVLTALLLFSRMSLAAIIHIPGDLETIQDGIDAAENRDTILVDTGTYVENISFEGKPLTLASLYLITGDEEYIDSTVIDGNQQDCVVTFDGSEGESSVLCGFTIRNGYSENGGGIICDDADPVLTHLVVTENTANRKGGGIFCDQGASPTISFVDLVINRAGTSGGGICCYNESSPAMDNVTAIENYAPMFGGGIHLSRNSQARLKNIIIRGNVAGDDAGGGLYCYHPLGVVIDSVVIAENQASSGGGIRVFGGVITIKNAEICNNIGIESTGGVSLNSVIIAEMDHVLIANNQSESDMGNALHIIESDLTATHLTISGHEEASPVYCSGDERLSLTSSILWNNSDLEITSENEYRIDVQYSDIRNGAEGISVDEGTELNYAESNIADNPCFVDSNEGDYHLSWENCPEEDETKSPCIDAADPDEPFDPDFSPPDMGMYYFRQALDISVMPDILYFPELSPGDCEEKYIQLMNRSQYTIPVVNQRIMPDDSTFQITFGGMDFDIDPDSDWQVRISFTPRKEGEFEAIYQAEIGNGNGTLMVVELFGSMLEVREDDVEPPSGFGIMDVYPNPFNSSTSLTYSLDRISDVSVRVFDVRGREVHRALHPQQDSGVNDLNIDASIWPSGIYFCRMEAGKYRQSVKLVLVR